MPQRIQRQRTKGWRMPANTVYVGRPSKWGNPFVLDSDWIVWAAVALGFRGGVAGRRSAALRLYRAWLLSELPAIDKPQGDYGAIVYDDGTPQGRTVETADQVQGFAGTIAALMEMPKLPASKPSLDSLRGKNLACFCPLDQPCHADVLLELANVGESVETIGGQT